MSHDVAKMFAADTVLNPMKWVQTERKTHEAWARLIAKKPMAAILMHQLVAHMGRRNAVVASQKVLSELVGCSTTTIKRSLQVLVSERWIQTIAIGKGKEAAYIVNSRVAWGEPRANLRLSAFSAMVIADARDQDTATLDDNMPLRKVPVLMLSERQLPAGEGEPPPSQPFIEGFEPDLPALEAEPRAWPAPLTDAEFEAGKPCPICAAGWEPGGKPDDGACETVTLEEMFQMMDEEAANAGH